MTADPRLCGCSQFIIERGNERIVLGHLPEEQNVLGNQHAHLLIDGKQIGRWSSRDGRVEMPCDCYPRTNASRLLGHSLQTPHYNHYPSSLNPA